MRLLGENMIEIRNATIQDAPKLMELYGQPESGRLQIGSHFVDITYLLNSDTSDAMIGSQILLGCLQAEVVAACIVESYLMETGGKRVTLRSLVVTPDHRHQGIGTQFVSLIVNEGAGFGSTDCVFTAYVQKSNKVAQHLFRKQLENEYATRFSGYSIPIKQDSSTVSNNGLDLTMVEGTSSVLAEFLSTESRAWGLVPNFDDKFIGAWMGIERDHQYKSWAIAKSHGKIVAAFAFEETYKIREMVFHQVPSSVKLVNNFFHLIPENNRIRPLTLSFLLQNPEYPSALSELIRFISEHYLGVADAIMFGLDRECHQWVKGIDKWYYPKANLSLFSSKPISGSHIFYG